MSRNARRGVQRGVELQLAGEYEGVALFVPGVTRNDVRRAERLVKASEFDSPHVVSLVTAVIRACGVKPADHTWSGGDYVTLLDIIGMPVPLGWNASDDTELEQLLTSGGASHGQ